MIYIFECRRDSFITHRAFCDALAQESSGSGRAVMNMNMNINMNLNNPLLHTHNTHQHHHLLQPPLPFLIKMEQDFPSLLSSTSSHLNLDQHLDQYEQQSLNFHNNNNSPYISATALLQKASQIGHIPHQSTSSSPPSSSPIPTLPFPLAFTSHTNSNNNSNYLDQSAPLCNNPPSPPSLPPPPTTNTSTISSSNFLHHHHQFMPNSSTGFAFHASSNSFDDLLTGMFNPITSDSTTTHNHFHFGNKTNKATTPTTTASHEITRDFLGLKPFPHNHSDFFNLSGLHHLASSSQGKHNHNQTPPWQA